MRVDDQAPTRSRRRTRCRKLKRAAEGQRERRGRGVANGEKPSGGARETTVKSRLDAKRRGRVGGRRRDRATAALASSVYQRSSRRDGVGTRSARGIGRERRTSQGQGVRGGVGQEFLSLNAACDSAPRIWENARATPRLRRRGTAFESPHRGAPDSSVAIERAPTTCRRNLGRLTTPRWVPRDASARPRFATRSPIFSRMSAMRSDKRSERQSAGLVVRSRRANTWPKLKPQAAQAPV